MLALHLFCAGDCGDYFGDLEPNFVQQITAIKAALTNGAAGATLSFDSSSSPDYWCELAPTGYQDRFRHVPSIESGSVSDIVSFMRWSRALYRTRSASMRSAATALPGTTRSSNAGSGRAARPK